jgi:hypothetical protein
VQRYRDAGATHPILTPVLGTDYVATLRGAINESKAIVNA